MASTVWVYPERTFEKLGAVRYQVSWEEVKPSAKGKEDIDPDSDIAYCFENFTQKAPAIKFAREVVDSLRTAYGGASVVKQVVDWFVEEDRVAEWTDTLEKECID